MVKQRKRRRDSKSLSGLQSPPPQPVISEDPTGPDDTTDSEGRRVTVGCIVADSSGGEDVGRVEVVYGGYVLYRLYNTTEAGAISALPSHQLRVTAAPEPYVPPVDPVEEPTKEKSPDGSGVSGAAADDDDTSLMLFRLEDDGQWVPTLPGDGRPDGIRWFTLEQAAAKSGQPISNLTAVWRAQWVSFVPTLKETWPPSKHPADPVDDVWAKWQAAWKTTAEDVTGMARSVTVMRRRWFEITEPAHQAAGDGPINGPVEDRVPECFQELTAALWEYVQLCYRQVDNLTESDVRERGSRR